MNYANSYQFRQNMRMISFIARTIALQHLNHERRNERICVLIVVIENIYSDSHNFSRDLTSEQRIVFDVLKLAAYSGNSYLEDHSDVKSRLYFIQELCRQGIAHQERADQEAEEKRQHEARIRQMEEISFAGEL